MSFDGNNSGSQFEGVVELHPSSRAQNNAPPIGDVRVPEPLRDLPYWLMWRLEQFTGEKRPRKIPYWPDGSRRRGEQGSPFDLKRLTTFAVAQGEAIRKGFDGVGFAHVAGANIITLDFDNCVTDGVVRSDLLDLVGGTYAEYSPSGTGIHAIFTGAPDLLANSKHKGTDGDFSVEAFSSTGFTTFTGWMLDHIDILGYEDKIAPIPDAVVDACRSRFGASSGAAFDPDDFLAGREPRLGLSVDEIQTYLNHLDPGMGRDPWLRVGMALHHETDGDDTGFDLWDEWSQGGHNYPSTEALRGQWDSFKPTPGKRLTTMASVIKMAKEAGFTSSASMATELEVQATAALVSASPYQWRVPMLIPQRPWLFGRWLLKGTVACVIAPGGIGKSTFVSAMALSCATGQDFLGKRVWGGPKKVWLWNLEDDLDELSRTIQATCLRHGITHEEVADQLFVDSGMDGSALCTATEDREGMKLLEPVYEALTLEIQRLGIEVLIIDPFVSSHAVEENSNSKIDKIVKAWGRVAKAAGCVVILVHHTSKAGSGEVNANSARGASALPDGARSVLTLNRLAAVDAKKYGIAEADRRRYFAVLDDKHNRAPAENDAWFELTPVELGNGDNVAACVPWRLPDTKVELSIADIIAIQKMIDENQYRDHPQADGWVGHAIASYLHLDILDPRDLARVKAVQKDMKNRRFLAVDYKIDKKGKSVPYSAAGVRPVASHD